VLIQEKRRRLEVQQEAQRELDQKQHTKLKQIDQWLAEIHEELLKQDGHHTDLKTYVEWEEDKANVVKIYLPLAKTAKKPWQTAIWEIVLAIWEMWPNK